MGSTIKMPSLTSFPSEILLQITSYLQPPPLNISSKPCQFWGAHVSNHQNSTLQKRKDIQSMAHTNSHFYSLLYPTIHSSLHLRNPDSPSKFWDSITPHNRLEESITSAHISSLSPEHLVFIFFLPSIRSIYLSDWNDWSTFDAGKPDDSLDGNSPITSLYLSNCGAREAAFSQVLRWPKALRELWYEAEQTEWEGQLEGEEAVGFTCSAITRAIQPLKNSLERFVFTRTCPGDEGYSDGIDLTGFSKLRELRTFRCFLVGWGGDDEDEDEGETWKFLPGSLESLELWYDDADAQNVDFLEGFLRLEWLFGVLENKQEAFPKLGKVRVVSFAECEGWEDEERTVELPIELRQAFEDAGVSYSVHVHQKAWFKEVVEGGSRFEEDWDEREIEDPCA